MKKYLFIILCSMSAIVMAEETAYVKMTLSANSSSATYSVKISEDSENTDFFEDGVDAELQTLTPANSNSVFIYAIVPTLEGGTKKCSSIYDNLVKDLHVGFQTNRVDDHYTITFTTVEGRNLLFYDTAIDSTFLITNNNPVYSFEVNASNYPAYVAGTNMLIEDRFIIEPVFAFQVCAYKDYVEITGNEGTDSIVITTLAGDTVVNKAPRLGKQRIDLPTEAQPGHYLLTVNDTTYQFIYKPDELNGEE